MPASEITAMSVVPPPMSTIMFPDGSVIGMPAPMAAAIASSTRCTSLAFARYALSLTARFSTCLISDGTPMTMRGRTHTLRLCAFLMKYVSIFSVTSKSAMTPSFIGLIATMLPGVRPSMSLASRPTASTLPLTLLMATIDGSLTTMPLPRAYTQVLAVPRSIARSLEKSEKREPKGNQSAPRHMDPVFPFVLHLVHGRVRDTQQVFGGLGDVWEGGD